MGHNNDECGCGTRLQHERSVTCSRYSVFECRNADVEPILVNWTFAEFPKRIQCLIQSQPELNAWMLELGDEPVLEVLVVRERDVDGTPVTFRNGNFRPACV
jgi:hypothetical protein